ncbi:hypothetical protein PQX77_002434 [Marasmius sp. AFHP31]|nr:hypothetical protein PQX77_002434 [Marasmius sp. AFHP31]
MFSRAECFQHTEIWPDGRVSLFGRSRGGVSPAPATRSHRVRFSSTTSSDPPAPAAASKSSHPGVPSVPNHTCSEDEQGAKAGDKGSDGLINDELLIDEADDVQTWPSDDSNLIKKPKGECGRPGTGGYNLEKKLDWTNTRFEEVKDFVRDQVLRSLDCKLSFTKQSQAKIKKIKQKTLAKFPFLCQYKNLWPVDDFILGIVKYRNSALKKASAVAALKAVNQAIHSQAVAGDDGGGRQIPNTRSRAKGAGIE